MSLIMDIKEIESLDKLKSGDIIIHKWSHKPYIIIGLNPLIGVRCYRITNVVEWKKIILNKGK